MQFKFEIPRGEFEGYAHYYQTELSGATSPARGGEWRRTSRQKSGWGIYWVRLMAWFGIFALGLIIFAETENPYLGLAALGVGIFILVAIEVVAFSSGTEEDVSDIAAAQIVDFLRWESAESGDYLTELNSFNERKLFGPDFKLQPINAFKGYHYGHPFLLCWTRKYNKSGKVPKGADRFMFYRVKLAQALPGRLIASNALQSRWRLRERYPVETETTIDGTQMQVLASSDEVRISESYFDIMQMKTALVQAFPQRELTIVAHDRYLYLALQNEDIFTYHQRRSDAQRLEVLQKLIFDFSGVLDTLDILLPEARP